MKYLIVLSLLVCQLSYVKGQYTFEFEMNTYQELENPISLDEGEDWNQDTNLSIFSTFDFEIGDQTYSAVNVLAGGGLTFPGLGLKQLFVFHTPFGGYMLRGSDPGGIGSEIAYEITGTTGEQILKIEWKNAGFVQFPTSDVNDYVNFQIWLFENDNHIEIRFGPHSTSPSTYGSPNYASNTGPSVKFLFDTCSNMFGLQGSADLPSHWFFDSCIPNYTFISGTPSDGMTYILNPDIIDGISDLEKKEFKVYPNPAKDYLFVSDLSELNIDRIQIKDLLGRTILNLEENEIYLSDMRISLEGMPQGVYLISVFSQNEELITKKFIKRTY